MSSILKSKMNPRVLLLMVFIIVFLLTRLPGLTSDTLNPDAVNWHYRSEQFINGLKYFQLEKTYQHYHPGVTLMWFAGVSVELAKHVLPHAATYSQYTFQTFDFIAKYTLIFVQLVLSIITVFLMTKVFVDYKNAFYLSVGIVFLFTFEPFFVGNSRLYHMDVLFTLVTFNSLLSAYLYIKNLRLSFGVLTGILLALSFLTRSVGIGAVLYVVCFGGLLVWHKDGVKQVLKYILGILLPFSLALPIILPALLKEALPVLTTIFQEGLRIGTRRGHDQIVLGEDTVIAGPSFYPLVLLIRVSLVTWLGMVISLKRLSFSFKKYLYSPIVFLTIFYVGYFLVFTLASKKLDRYMITLFPYFATFAGLGFYSIYEKLLGKIIIGVSIAVFFVLPMVTYFPYYFIYSSPIVGSFQNANSIVGFKPFGIGIYELRTYVDEKYGRNLKIGFLDPKPFESIYSASKVKDIEEEGISGLNLIILGPNEDFPEQKISDAFNYDSSFYLNGIAYWRVYVKKN